MVSFELPDGLWELAAGLCALLAFGVLFALAQRRFRSGEQGERTRVPGLD
jgi:hypothetical protein